MFNFTKQEERREKFKNDFYLSADEKPILNLQDDKELNDSLDMWNPNVNEEYK